MKVINDYGNLIYDTEYPACAIECCQSQGEWYAFITVLDLGFPESRLKKPIKKQYWGRYDPDNEESSIHDILHHGGKWPLLRKRVKWI